MRKTIRFRLGQGMASVGKSVRAAIDEWTRSDHDLAMLHACNAVDGTGKKCYPSIHKNKERFVKTLRDNFSILGPLGIPGIDIVNTRWPVKIRRATAVGGQPDIADVIYSVHRCTQGHGDELPDGFELIPNAAGPARVTIIEVARGKVRLSDRIIFGLLGVAVFSAVNADQKVPDGYHLTFAEMVLPINEWWGRAVDFIELASKEPMPNVKMDFTDWMGAAK